MVTELLSSTWENIKNAWKTSPILKLYIYSIILFILAWNFNAANHFKYFLGISVLIFYMLYLFNSDYGTRDALSFVCVHACLLIAVSSIFFQQIFSKDIIDVIWIPVSRVLGTYQIKKQILPFGLVLFCIFVIFKFTLIYSTNSFPKKTKKIVKATNDWLNKYRLASFFIILIILLITLSASHRLVPVNFSFCEPSYLETCENISPKIYCSSSEYIYPVSGKKLNCLGTIPKDYGLVVELFDLENEKEVPSKNVQYHSETFADTKNVSFDLTMPIKTKHILITFSILNNKSIQQFQLEKELTTYDELVALQEEDSKKNTALAIMSFILSFAIVSVFTGMKALKDMNENEKKK